MRASARRVCVSMMALVWLVACGDDSDSSGSGGSGGASTTSSSSSTSGGGGQGGEGATGFKCFEQGEGAWCTCYDQEPAFALEVSSCMPGGDSYRGCFVSDGFPDQSESYCDCRTICCQKASGCYCDASCDPNDDTAVETCTGAGTTYCQFDTGSGQGCYAHDGTGCDAGETEVASCDAAGYVPSGETPSSSCPP